MKKSFWHTILVIAVLFVLMKLTAENTLYLCFAAVPFLFFFMRCAQVKNLDKTGIVQNIYNKVKELDAVVLKNTRFVDSGRRYMKNGEKSPFYDVCFQELIHLVHELENK